MQVTLEAQELEYLDLIKRLNPDEQTILIDGIKNLIKSLEQETSSEEDNLVKALANRTFTRQEKIQLKLESLRCYFHRRRQLLENVLTATEVAQLLGTSRQTPHDRLKNQTLLAIKDNGAYRFPIWQFDPQGPDGVIEGLPDVLKCLQVSDFAKLNWFVRPNPYLDELTPLEALKQGQKERVIQEAKGIGGVDC